MAQFPFDVLDVDWPRPRLVRCVMTVVLATGTFGTDVGADVEAATTGGAVKDRKDLLQT